MLRLQQELPPLPDQTYNVKLPCDCSICAVVQDMLLNPLLGCFITEVPANKGILQHLQE